MPGVDLVKAGFGEVKDPAAREAADAGERVSLFFKDGFRLMRDDGSFALFKQGENSVLASDADHWMVKAHIIEPPAAPEPAAKAPEPRSNVVLNSGAENAKPGTSAATPPTIEAVTTWRSNRRRGRWSHAARKSNQADAWRSAKRTLARHAHTVSVSLMPPATTMSVTQKSAPHKDASAA